MKLIGAAAVNGGALGGKLLGACGGYLLLYLEDKDRERLKLKLALPKKPVRFDGQGSTVVYIGNETHLCV